MKERYGNSVALFTVRAIQFTPTLSHPLAAVSCRTGLLHGVDRRTAPFSTTVRCSLLAHVTQASGW